MSYAAIWAYPWDIYDEGPELVVSTLADDMGLDAVHLAATYHTVRMVMPHHPQHRVYDLDSSAVYFWPQLALYADTPIKPYVSPLASQENLLRTIGERCRARSLGLVAWTICLHNSRLGREYPQFTIRNAYGDRYYPYLCPSQPAARSYLKALARDLATNYPVMALELESANFGGFYHYDHHSKPLGSRLGRKGEFLLSLCFCDACQERARSRDVDSALLIARVKSYLDDALEHVGPFGDDRRGEEEQTTALLEEVPQLAAYVEMRQEVVSSLVKEVRERAGLPIYFIIMGDPWVSGVNGREMLRIVDKVGILCYTPSTEEVRRRLEEVRDQLGSLERLTVALSGSYTCSPSAEALEGNVRQALELGVRSFGFYNYGLMSRQALSWVKGAVAIIRRANSVAAVPSVESS